MNQNISWGRFNLNLAKRAQVMGIINVTPDSFSDGGLFFNKDSAIRGVYKLVEEGADIIDIGGESSRPGARAVSLKEELSRVIPIIKECAKRIAVPISIDTQKAEVAQQALDNGASMVNDISGLKNDLAMAKVVAQYKVPVVIMHIKGTPRNMQKNPYYKNLITEIINSLKQSIKIAHQAGIKNNKIIIDPGIGFGKRLRHNLLILKNLTKFKSLGYPISVGTSRKSFIGKVLRKEVEDRLVGSLASAVVAIQNGASILRVHDVEETVMAVKMAEAILKIK